MRTLWLLRHAEAAERTGQGGGDKERPLTPRGARDATALGRRLAAGDGVFGLGGVPVPEAVVCSAAKRTRHTADLVVASMAGQGSGTTRTVDSYHSLYGATPDVWLGAVAEIDAGFQSALVVGHNPAIYQFVWGLLASGDSTEGGDPSAQGDGRSVLEGRGFPTCGLAVVRLPIRSWEEVAFESGWLAGVFHPPY